MKTIRQWPTLYTLATGDSKYQRLLLCTFVGHRVKNDFLYYNLPLALNT